MSGSLSLSAFVLAGGKSTRMGTDKAFVQLDGRSLLERALDLGRTVTADVCIVGDVARFGSYAAVVEDVYPDRGPLGGIHAALRASRTELNLILAVDIPFVMKEFLRYLIARAQNAPTAVVTVPKAGGRWQPLCAVYRRAFSDAAESALRAGRYKIDALYGSLKIEVVEESEMMEAGFSGEMFRNLNTKDDLLTAKSASSKLEASS